MRISLRTFTMSIIAEQDVDPASGDAVELDPVFVHAKREAVIVLVVFTLFMLVSLGVSYSLAPPSGKAQAAVDLVLGMPHWVFWGIFLPWMFANVVTAWFCFVTIKRDDLTEPDGGDERPESLASDAGQSSAGGANH